MGSSVSPVWGDSVAGVGTGSSAEQADKRNANKNRVKTKFFILFIFKTRFPYIKTARFRKMDFHEPG
jgi:hypothetical protein